MQTLQYKEYDKFYRTESNFNVVHNKLKANEELSLKTKEEDITL